MANTFTLGESTLALLDPLEPEFFVAGGFTGGGTLTWTL